MEQAYPVQMKALAELAKSGDVHVETMGKSGARFKQAFRHTPPQSQVMLEDPFQNVGHQEGSIWYQSRFYRANLHLSGDLPFLRDITVYSDACEQPFLREATRAHDVEQRMPAVLDGYHWSPTPGSEIPKAGGFFTADCQRLTCVGKPIVTETRGEMTVDISVSGGGVMRLHFDEKNLRVELKGTSQHLAISFEWDPSRSSFKGLKGKVATYEQAGFNYHINVSGDPTVTGNGWLVTNKSKPITLHLAQA
jgi:hypothetical protein